MHRLLNCYKSLLELLDDTKKGDFGLADLLNNKTLEWLLNLAPIYCWISHQMFYIWYVAKNVNWDSVHTDTHVCMHVFIRTIHWHLLIFSHFYSWILTPYPKPNTTSTYLTLNLTPNPKTEFHHIILAYLKQTLIYYQGHIFSNKIVKWLESLLKMWTDLISNIRLSS